MDIRCCDAFELLGSLDDASVSLVCVDPPYHRCKDKESCPWDNQWKTDADFLSWIGRLCDEFRRVLKPNGSLYLFASPQMAWGVEAEARKRLNVLNRIRWVKGAGWHQRADKEEIRSWLLPYEEIIFAEHPSASVEWENSSDGAKAIAFESVREYLSSERDRAGWTTRRVAEEYQKRTGSRTVTGMAGHWFDRVQWCLPTAENYQWLRELFNKGGETDYLRREYEDLRRPFFASAERPYTAVWSFKTVNNYPGKHLCEKPLEMIEHIVETSSRPGDLVLDCFLGSGTTAQACQTLERSFIGCDNDPHWVEQTQRRLDGRRPVPIKRKSITERLPLFDQEESTNMEPA